MEKRHWLDKYIEEQREQRELILKITGGVEPAELQEYIEQNGLDG